VTTSFGMQDRLLKTITHNGTTYTNDYDNQNRVTALKVGSQTLVSNTYDSRRRLSQQSYANGATYAPVYDSRDRQTGEKWNGVQTIEHFYNENDRLSQTVDKTAGVTYKYDYAFFGLLNKIIGSDGTVTAYDYDMAGKLSNVTKFCDMVKNVNAKRAHTLHPGCAFWPTTKLPSTTRPPMTTLSRS
jgi:YD repeat-containing protein